MAVQSRKKQLSRDIVSKANSRSHKKSRLIHIGPLQLIGPMGIVALIGTLRLIGLAWFV